jgi:hypothetical protein
MSDTPETDAEAMQDEWDHVDTDFGPFAPSTMVSAEFARELERERDELIERNAKLRDIAERAIEMKEQEVWGTGELPFSWKQLRAELDQLKECGK